MNSRVRRDPGIEARSSEVGGRSDHANSAASKEPVPFNEWRRAGRLADLLHEYVRKAA